MATEIIYFVDLGNESRVLDFIHYYDKRCNVFTTELIVIIKSRQHFKDSSAL